MSDTPSLKWKIVGRGYTGGKMPEIHLMLTTSNCRREVYRVARISLVREPGRIFWFYDGDRCHACPDWKGVVERLRSCPGQYAKYVDQRKLDALVECLLEEAYRWMVYGRLVHRKRPPEKYRHLHDEPGPPGCTHERYKLCSKNGFILDWESCVDHENEPTGQGR